MSRRHGMVDGGVRLWFADVGERRDPPILLIIGQGGDSSAWDTDFVAALTGAGFRVVKFDNRDSGRSGDAEDANYLIADLAEDALRVLDHLGIDSAHLVGQSMGGMVAQELAIGSDSRVRSLTLISTSPDPSIAPPDPAFTQWFVETNMSDGADLLEIGLESARRQTGTRWRFDEALFRERWEQVVGRGGFRPEAATRQLFACFRSPPRTDALRDVTVAALIVHGTEDPLLPVAHGRALAQALPCSKLVEVEGWGHVVPWGHWDIVLDPLIPHLVAAERIHSDPMATELRPPR